MSLAKSKKDAVSKSWMLTLNNPDHYTEDCKTIKNIFDTDSLSSGIVSLEYGDKEKTPHWQILIVFRKAKRFSAIKKLIPHAKLLPSTRTDFSYKCKGEIVFIKKGQPGLRTDLIKIYEDCKTMDMNEIAHAHPDSFIRFHGGIQKMHNLVNDKDDDKSSYSIDQFTERLDMDFKGTHLVIGQAGSGKTQWALAHFKNPCLITSREDFGKFKRSIHDGIVIDDMDLVDHFKGQNLVNVLDFDCKRTINIKYGSATIPKHTKKIILHNDINKILKFEAQFMRRVFVTEVGNSNTCLPTSVLYKKINKLF